MFFNHKTKQFTGKLEDTTPEKEAFIRQQVETGVMVSTRHPSQEEIDEELKWREEHEFNEGLEDRLR